MASRSASRSASPSKSVSDEEHVVEFKNISGDDLEIPSLEVKVAAGGTFEVTGDAAQALLDNPAFKRVDKPAARSTDE